ncbi:AAA family ATPase [Noviherbaspirillum sedimenti]|nr:bifunctional aminoglycoside phosphotransferase/ATP-binding protein [Noviherbaspirillum sedimenti]
MPMEPQDAPDLQEKLVRALAGTLQAASAPVSLFETHISWILVAGQSACKIKKAVRFDFLDFSTLAARRFYCEEELRLNRRLAPQLYLEVQAITGSADAPLLGGSGPAIEYALRMRAFPQEALWSERVVTGAIAAGEIDQLAAILARFHHEAPVAPSDSRWGTPALLRASADEILDTLAQALRDPADKPRVDALLEWHQARHVQLCPTFERRRREGYVREGHGDLHCGNILTVDGHATAFDCIEFSEGLRWIDVLNDIAFATMDLQVCGRADLAARLLDRYLEASGDYLDLALWRHYQTLRALVRCKVYLLRLQELAADAPQRTDCERRMQAYLGFACASISPASPALMIMHGFSGSGKSTVAGAVVELCGAVRIRSDVERKRMQGIAAGSPAAGDLYAPAVSDATYARLGLLARRIVEAGLPVVVDAAFLDRAQRQRFAALARELGVPFLIFDVRADAALMRERLARRARQGGDPSDAGVEVLALQLVSHHPLSAEEMPHVAPVDSAGGNVAQAIRFAWNSLQAVAHCSANAPS